MSRRSSLRSGQQRALFSRIPPRSYAFATGNQVYPVGRPDALRRIEADAAASGDGDRMRGGDGASGDRDDVTTERGRNALEASARGVGMEWKLFADLAEIAGDRVIAVDAESGDTVGDALDDLLDSRPALRERVIEDGAVADHINVLRNGRSVYHDDGLSTTLKDGDELALFPPVSGG